jgi:hypothetical protein
LTALPLFALAVASNDITEIYNAAIIDVGELAVRLDH